MPKMVFIEPNPDYAKGGTPEDSKAKSAEYQAAKAAGRKEVSWVTAMECVRRSNGLYRIIEQEPPTSEVPAPRRLEDMDQAELKMLMVNLGIKTEKTMKRVDVIRLVQKKLDEVQIEDGASE